MKRRPIKPPKWAEGFFKWYCRNELAESILGDLDEQFYDNLEKSGKFKAQINYCFNTIRFINRYTLKNFNRELFKQMGFQIMLRHHFLTSYRSLSKHKIFTVINICGLAIGLASCLLIANFLRNELSYDQFHKESHNIYRINTLFIDDSGTITKMANTPPALVPGIREVFSEIKKSTQLRYAQRVLMEKGEHRFYENHGFYADSLFLEVFSFHLLDGNQNTALDQPNSVVITREMASKYFGNEDPMGKIITMNNDITLKITGILESIPSNSHLQFDFLVSFSTYVVPDGYLSDLSSWSWAGFLSYVLLNNDSNPNDLQDKIDQRYREIFSSSNPGIQSHVQPLEGIYLDSNDLVDDLASNLQSGNRFTIYTLVIVALLILIIASFNFMNLSIAVAVSRTNEVGLRKVLGAEKSGLVAQFLTESVMLGFISLTLAYLLSLVAFHNIKDVLEWDFIISWTNILYSLPIAVVITFLVGIVAGFYPALLLSSHKTVVALKSNVKNSISSGSKLRKVLISFQFFISVSLIAATIIIVKQFQYLSDQKLGFDKENVVVIKLLGRDMTRYYETLKNNLLQNNHIISVTRSEREMGEPWPVNMVQVEGSENSVSKQIFGNQVGYNFLETMGIKLKDGRTFSKEFGSDINNSVIINEKAAQYLDLDHPIGKNVQYFSFDGPRTVIGVVEDFNFLSLHHEITPMALVLPFVDIKNIHVRVSSGKLTDKITALQNIWEETNPGVPLEYHFMDDHLNQLYNNEKKLSYLIFGFSGLTIILACMGLYGLIAFTLKQSRKEIGIRKVLGASISSLLVRFSLQYILLIGIASIIAIPAVQYILSLWLENFAYRIEINWWIYIISMLTLIVIALFTISHQAISAALVNPVNVLKDE